MSKPDCPKLEQAIFVAGDSNGFHVVEPEFSSVATDGAPQVVKWRVWRFHGNALVVDDKGHTEFQQRPGWTLAWEGKP